MKPGRKILALMMAVMMLLSMTQTAMAYLDVCNHNVASRWPNGKPANCQDWKEHEEYCTICGASFGTIMECGECRLGSKVWPEGRPSSCEEWTYWEIRCIYCDECLDTGEESGEHRWSYHVLENPTCTEDGWAETTCSVCGSESGDMEKLEALGHDWDSGKNITDASCINRGEVRYTCKRCGATNDEPTDYGPHSWGEWVKIKKGDCTHPGTEERKCSLCGQTQTRQTEGGDHDWGRWKTVKEPTCTENGREERKCSICGKTDDDTIGRLGHAWGEWVVIKEAVYPEPGIRERKCSRCGLTEQELFYPEGTLQNGDMNNETVKEIQEELNDQGYNCGTADGDFGPKTEEAWKNWQEDHGYNNDGIMWPGQVDELLGKDPENTGASGVTFEKSIRYQPANGQYFVPGETIYYTMAYGLPAGYWAYDIEVTDPMKGSNEDSVIWRVPKQGGAPEGSFSGWGGEIKYVVTKEDAAAGVLTNTATMIWWDPETEQQYTLTASATANTGYGDDEVQSGPNLTKAVTSTPANGQSYELGETIVYEFTFSYNGAAEAGDSLKNLTVYDQKCKENNGVLYKADTFNGTQTASFSYTVTEEDVARGYITNQGCMTFQDSQTGLWETLFSNSVTVFTRASNTAEAYGVTLTKQLMSAPANGSCFVPGEEVTYGVTFLNITKDKLAVTLRDYNGTEFVEYTETVEPGKEFSHQFVATVTTEDATRGYRSNVAEAVWNKEGDANKSTIFSNQVVITCGFNEPEYGQGTVYLGELSIAKTVLNAPANGSHFVPGETIQFSLSIRNGYYLPISSVSIHDDLYSFSEPLKTYEVMNPGFVDAVTFDYVVTEMDAAAGKVVNAATAVGYDTEGRGIAGFSNTVEVPAGMAGDAPMGVITEMTIVKEETSAPANGKYYTEGETISYKITYTNSGETAFGETIIYDSLAAGSGEIASAEILSPGETRHCLYSYVVTAADVARGYVANIALAEFDIGGGYINSAISNVVISDTDGDENTTYVPGSGTIDWEEIRGTDVDENGIAMAKEDTCYRKVLARDGEKAEYEMHFCSEHVRMQNTILTMLKTAGDDAGKQQMAWEYAYALWQKELNAMYDKLLSACDEVAKITVMNERVTHMATIANTQFALKIATPDQPVETARAIANLWQDKCVDMCYLINTAPNERVDSLFTVVRADNAVEHGEKCSCVVAEEEAGKVLYADHFCAVHGFTYEMMDVLLAAGRTVEAWETVRALWEIELNNVYTDLYEASDDQGGMAYMVEYSAFMKWLPALEEYLNTVYPQQPEIVAEVIVNTIMGRALDACERD